MNKAYHKKILILGISILIIGLLLLVKFTASNNTQNEILNVLKNPTQTTKNLNPLSIKAMREKSYPGSNLVIEQTLAPEANYNQYIASYLSDGLKIYGLLTIPIGEKPKSGWPVIIFNHGYIAPEQYRTTERYVAYVDYFARNGYIVFKSDYRGNGNSQGQPQGPYYSPAYATDVLNAISTLKKYKDADPNRMGMWGHSMGGNITLRSLVVDTQDIKVAVIWGGVVGSYNDILYNWQRRVSFQPSQRDLSLRNGGKQSLLNQFGTPAQNPSFWNSIDPTYFVSDVKAPIQLDVGSSDEEVPTAFSKELYAKLKNTGKTVELYEYPGSDHNISQGFSLAMQRSLNFFDKYLKGGE